MNWIRFALGVLAGGTLSSLSDWLFMGDLLYKRNNKYPEIWRYPGGRGESKAIWWSSPFTFLTCAIFTLACNELHLHSLGWLVKLGVAAGTAILFLK